MLEGASVYFQTSFNHEQRGGHYEHNENQKLFFSIAVMSLMVTQT
jgi:hypothetical protein